MMLATEESSMENCMLKIKKGKAEQAKGNYKLTANLKARRPPCLARLSRPSDA